MTKTKSKQQLKIEELRTRLKELQDTLDAIRSGGIDAIVTSGPGGDRVYTLEGADHTYRMMVESMNEGAVIIHSDGTILYSNNQFAQLIDSVSDEVTGQRFQDFVHASDRQAVYDIITLNETKAEIRLLGRSGHETIVQITAGPIEIGNIKAMTLVITDLTGMKRIEEELRLSGAIMANIAEAIILVSVDENKILHANPRFDRMFGYESGELIGRHVSIVNAPGTKSPDEVAEGISSELKQTGTWTGVLELRKKDASTFWCKAHITGFHHPVHGHVWLNVLTDVDDLKKLEEELSEERRFLSQLIEQSGAVIQVKDGQNRFRLVNRKWEEVTGCRREDTLGKTVREVFPGITSSQFHRNDLKVIQQGTTLEAEEFLETASGRRYFNSVKFPLVGEDGRVRGVCGMATEITERKIMEEELKIHREELAHLVEEKTKELGNKAKILEDLNTAMKVMLQRREQDKTDLEERFVTNIRNMILPYVQKMKTGGLDEGKRSYLMIIESHLDEIVSPLLKNLNQFNLTPTETRVASHIKSGKTTKQIAELMGIAAGSVDTHRKRIRKKLNLRRTVNLQAYILSLAK